MSKKKNPKNAGRKKYADPGMVKESIGQPCVTRKAIMIHGGKAAARKEAARHLEETAKILENKK